MWTIQFGSIYGSSGGYYISKDRNNNFFVVGNANGNIKIGNNDGFLMKIDSNGSIILAE